MHKIFLNSFPKGGTHLVMKLLELFGYSVYSGLQIQPGSIYRNEIWLKKMARQLLSGGLLPNTSDSVLIGIGLSVFVRANWIRQALSRVQPNQLIIGHAPYTEYLYHMLLEKGFKIIQVIRDPRDIVVSHVHYITNEKTHILHRYYKSLNTWDDRLTFSIRGGYVPGIGYLESIAARSKVVDEWLRKDDVLRLRFEDLIGPRGGGNIEAQQSIIRKAADFVHASVNGDSMQYIGLSLFGGTQTFRKGVIGNWKEEFSPTHRQLFWDLAGNYLGLWGYE